MIKPEQVPTGVAAVFDAVWEMTRRTDKALAAALNAWPGMGSIMLPRMVRPGHFVPQNYIRLPLAQKQEDGDGN